MCAFPVTVSRHCWGNGCLSRMKSLGPSAPQQPTWKDHINCWIFFNKSSKNSHIFLDERQSVCTGTIVRGHDQASQRPLQDGLNSRVHGTVGQHESRSNHAEDEGEDLRSNKLKQFGVKLNLEKTPKTTAVTHHQQSRWVLHESTATAKEWRDHNDNRHSNQDVNSNVEWLKVQ